MTNTATIQGEVIFSAPAEQSAGLNPNSDLFAQAFLEGIFGPDYEVVEAEEEVPLALARPAKPVSTQKEKKVLAQPARLIQHQGDFCPRNPEFKPQTTWGTHYKNGELTKISCTVEVLQGVTGTVVYHEKTPYLEIFWNEVKNFDGVQIIRDRFHKAILLDIICPEDKVGRLVIKLDTSSVCEIFPNHCSGGYTITRNARQKQDGEKLSNGIYFPRVKTFKEGAVCGIVFAPKGDTRPEYKNAISYLALID
jgi:hypothetical protein